MFRPHSPSTSPTKTPQTSTYTQVHGTWQNKVQAKGARTFFQITGWDQVPGTCILAQGRRSRESCFPLHSSGSFLNPAKWLLAANRPQLEPHDPPFCHLPVTVDESLSSLKLGSLTCNPGDNRGYLQEARLRVQRSWHTAGVQ